MFKIKINNRKFFNDVLVDILQVNNKDVKMISKVIDKKAKTDPEKYIAWLRDIGLSRDNIDKLERIFSSQFSEIVQMMNIDSRGAGELYELFRLLKEAGLEDYYEFDFSIVRGFDYYTGTVFEVYDTSPGNKRSLFGGGRYDNLVSMYKDQNISGIGFGLGDVTFQHFLAGHHLIPESIYTSPQILITRFNEIPVHEYISCAQRLRAENLSTVMYFSGNDKLGKQLKFAQKKGFSIVLIMGIDELKENKITLKHMDSKEQITIDRERLVDKVKEYLA
jgi:histidyl-tRNA synthetase